MFNFWKYAYYRCYKWQLGLYGEKWDPADTATHLINVLIFAPYLIIIAIVIRFEPFGVSFAPRTFIVITIILMLIEDFFVTSWLKRKHANILKKYKNESKKQSNKGSLLIMIYISFLIAVPIIILAAPGRENNAQEEYPQKIEKSIFKHERTMEDFEGYEKEYE